MPPSWSSRTQPASRPRAYGILPPVSHLHSIEGGGEDAAREADASIVFYEELDPQLAALRSALDGRRRDEARIHAARLGEVAAKLERLLRDDPA